MKVKLINRDEFRPNKYDMVKVTECGNVIELMEMTHKPFQCPIKRLGSDYYCKRNDYNIHTGEVVGEIKKMKKTKNRSENIVGMRKSMKKLRDIINCNITDPKKCRWITLTYAENMQDSKILKTDHDAFMKRLRRYHSKRNIPQFEYIAVVEPQGRGAWHVHSLWVYPSIAPFLPNKDIADLWGHGYVTVKAVDDVDNVGAYLTAYLCDISEDQAKKDGLDIDQYEIKEVDVDVGGSKEKKRYVKGARLHMYPSGINFYRTSRGIKRPSVEWVKREQAKNKVRGASLTYEKSIRINSDDNEKKYENDILYRYYNRVRKQ